jgi:hypothetical protein
VRPLLLRSAQVAAIGLLALMALGMATGCASAPPPSPARANMRAGVEPDLSGRPRSQASSP